MSVSGACVVSKLSGMVHVREDATPLVVEWVAIDLLKRVTIPFAALTNLQALKETTPKLMLKLFYSEGGQPRDVKLTFLNRPTMNKIKETLQLMLARRRAAAAGGTAAATAGGSPTPAPATPVATPAVGLPSPEDAGGLSDASLLRNHALQQKLLFEDKLLREKFTQAVINYKLLPAMFWQSRLNQLRTYALTILQHRGPYNVLSTIKPVATSDNQVNVNVTRDTIREIFDTYPIVRRLFNELVPANFSEGEFWSRFFNSRLFRRLRGDRINNSNERGDVVLDKYLYVDQDYEEAPGAKRAKINKFIDLGANEEDNLQRLGNQPDITMRYGDPGAASLLNPKKREQGAGAGAGAASAPGAPGAPGENEMLVIMRNMNRLSEKMVAVTESEQSGDQSAHAKSAPPATNEYADELDLHDLNEPSEVHFIPLRINTALRTAHEENAVALTLATELALFMAASKFVPPVNLTFSNRDDIERTLAEIIALVKHNFRAFRMGNMNNTKGDVISAAMVQRILTIHTTSMELLLHFWRGFLGGDPAQAVATRKIVVALKKCLAQYDAIEKECVHLIEAAVEDAKTREKMAAEVRDCLASDRGGLTRACREYGQALARAESATPEPPGAAPAEAAARS
jgi:transcription initiation factor TFIIH subunit 1